ncbi:hypothetical protein L195_g042465 [Trifolium pratense]|uniref:Uncharacterized protein n=1 Tax=Trifolium pratense TaxID=57577 RepID=A0A2K3M6H0_TRIPR|nr:hypothetical protein L195_g042465 [Trifolium pratense]
MIGNYANKVSKYDDPYVLSKLKYFNYKDLVAEDETMVTRVNGVLGDSQISINRPTKFKWEVRIHVFKNYQFSGNIIIIPSYSLMYTVMVAMVVPIPEALDYVFRKQVNVFNNYSDMQLRGQVDNNVRFYFLPISAVYSGWQTLNFWVHKIEEGKTNSLSINLMKFMTKISNLGHFSKPQVAADKENYNFAIVLIMKNLKKLRDYLLGLKVEKYTRVIIIIHHMMQPSLDIYNKGKEINVCSLRSLVDKIELLSSALVETLAQFAWIEMLMQSSEGMKIGVVLGIMCRYGFIQWDPGELNFLIATDDYCLGGLLTFHGWFNFVFDRGKF